MLTKVVSEYRYPICVTLCVEVKLNAFISGGRGRIGIRPLVFLKMSLTAHLYVLFINFLVNYFAHKLSKLILRNNWLFFIFVVDTGVG